MAKDDWDARVSGDDCPFCTPRPDDSDLMQLIAPLGVSSLYLNKSQTYRGACILVYDTAHTTRVDQLPESEWLAYANDIRDAQQAIVAATNPDHMNTESLGNVVPHLHFHLVPRYKDDGRWRDPIWMTDMSTLPMKRLPADEFSTLRDAIRKNLPRR
jgi:diadenosine tetraphosphate (Ap4A) HIT family hydrolase